MKGGLKLPVEYLELMKSQAGRRRKRAKKVGGLSLKPIKQAYHHTKDYIVHHAKKLAHNIKYKFKNDKAEEVRKRPVHTMAELKKVKEDLINMGLITDPELRRVYEPRANQPFEVIPVNAPLLLGDGRRKRKVTKETLLKRRTNA